jgi:hypothetical protein
MGNPFDLHVLLMRLRRAEIRDPPKMASADGRERFPSHCYAGNRLL